MSRRFSRVSGGGSAAASVAVFGAWGWSASNVSSARPSSSYGTAVTPAQNAFGSWAQLLAAGSVTNAVRGVLVTFTNTNASTLAKDCVVDIGVDPAGGTSYTTLLPSLFASNCPGVTSEPGTSYYFPIAIAAGSSIAARASVNNATVGTVRVQITVFGSPTVTTRAGTAVQAVGLTAASSAGTAVTPGQAAEGAWTTMGTLSAESWFFQLGVGINTGTATGGTLVFDAAEGDGNTMLITDALYISTAGEVLMPANPLNMIHQSQRTIANGSTIKVRGQCSGVPDAAWSAIVYAVSGDG